MTAPFRSTQKNLTVQEEKAHRFPAALALADALSKSKAAKLATMIQRD